MKKLYASFVGVGLFFLIIFGFKLHMNAAIESHAVGVRNHRSYERYWSRDTQKHIIEDNTLVIFGSSELRPLNDIDECVSNFLNGDAMNVLTIGGGSFQSLSHTITLGAISEAVSSKKVALFLSPQWFTENGCNADAFSARMSEDELLGFLNNSRISGTQKSYVLKRTIELLNSSPTQLKRVKKYQNAKESKYFLDLVYMKLMNQYWRYRAEFEVYKQLGDMSDEVPVYNLSELDFDAILEQAERQGEKACTNNDFGIYDEYWDTYVQKKYVQGEVQEKVQIYTESPEYEDLNCFLTVADELGIEVLLVSIPVHEQWSAYRGELCDDYYNKIASIGTSHKNVTLIDMTQYAGEKYFLKDVMHLGWKGWARINERLYQEFVGK